jgi:hypothetical protein
VLNTEGDINYNGEPLHASAEKTGFSAGDTVNFNFDETTVISGVSVNGESITVVSALEGESSSVIEVGNLAQLQAMQEDLDADYKLIRNIDASETENWNEKTSDEFTSYSVNGDTIQLNLVASEGTINVVDSTGTDVAFTSNTNNDSITIDDTAIDTPQNLTISYDLETPINQGFDPIGDNDVSFTGSLDGKKYDISGLNIKRQSEWYVGLFGAIGAGGEVKNVGVINVNMTGYNTVGSLAGINYGEISNSNTDGVITGNNRVGGLVGGLVDLNEGGNITNSHSSGDVNGMEYIGGLVGDNYNGNISNSYATGSVSINSGSNVGGLLGNSSSGSVSDSYWDIESTGQSSSAVLPDSNGLTTSEMQGSSAEGNMNFDFTSTWSTVEGDYPELQG